MRIVAEFDRAEGRQSLAKWHYLVTVNLVECLALEFESKACEGPKIGVYSRK